MSNRQSTIIGTLVMVAVIAGFTAAPVSAQTCGDANGNDTVTVTDGVQALRQAAGLSSSCEDGCDVDGSGGVTVSDGVNILRKAAGLGINEACDFTGQEANGVVNPSLSIFDGITKVPGVGSGAFAAGGLDCENDGTVETTPSPNAQVTTFTNCEITGAILDGTIGRVVLGQGIALGFQGYRITRIKTGKSLTYDGQLSVVDAQLGKRINGTLTVMSSERGTFTLEFQRILLAGDGSVREGALIHDLTNADGGKIAKIQITFDDGDLLPVSILLRNKQVRQFILNRGTRLLLPAV
jgi:hypothetical protein